VFLHARKLMQMAGVPYGRRLYRVNSVMNLFTFVSCRFLCLAWIVYGMWMWHARVSPIYLVVLGATMFILWVTNAVLFWRLLCSDVLRGRRQKQRASSADPKTNRHLNSNGFGHSTKSAVNGVALNGTSSQHDFENNHAQLQQCEDSHPCYSNNSLLHRTSVQSTDVNGVMNDGLKNSL
jgi:ABC-type nickel/cobalt efflux system permease component RcnA